MKRELFSGKSQTMPEGTEDKETENSFLPSYPFIFIFVFHFTFLLARLMPIFFFLL